MKRYKLKKDAPCAKAGIVFEERVDEFDGKILINEEFKYKIIVDCVNNFDDWLEEIPEHKRPRAEYGEKYHYINDCGDIVEDYKDEDDSDDYCYSIGNYGLTVKELEVKREYNIARQTLLDDAEGGKFSRKGCNWHAYYDGVRHKMDWDYDYSYNPGTIYFKTEEALKKSLEEHKEQWETVRKYEMGEM
jgi:hypothetical protein|nr:MAG TPA: hypothetical protein [Caudoviricetes sp.]